MPPEDRKTELTREWFETALEDLEAAELMLGAAQPLPSVAVFHCQQAFEKVLKGFLTWHDRPFRRTHDLGDLVTLCEAIDPSFAQLRDGADELTPYAAQFRYPPVPAKPSVGDAAAALRLAREALSFTRTRLPDTVGL